MIFDGGPEGAPGCVVLEGLDQYIDFTAAREADRDSQVAFDAISRQNRSGFLKNLQPSCENIAFQASSTDGSFQFPTFREA